MAEVKDNIVLQGDGDADKTVAALANDNLALVKAYEDTIHSFEDLVPTIQSFQSPSNDVKERETSEEDEGTEKVEEGETQKAPAGSELQCEEAAESKAKSPESKAKSPESKAKSPESKAKSPESKAKSEWEIGAQCTAVWSKDGRVYPGKVVWMDGQCCRVKFDGYSSEEEMVLSALKRPEPTEQQQEDRTVWRAGSRCRAVYSEDGLAYPAVLLWIEGERCRIRFDGYGNEQELDLASLLSQDDLNGPSGAACTRQATSGDRSTYNSSSTWRRRKTEGGSGERTGGERDWERRAPQQEEQLSPHLPNLTSGKEWSRNYNKAEKNQGDRMRGSVQKDVPERPSSNPFSVFPPMPPQSSGQGEFLPFLPPPPPLMYMWPPRAEGKEARAGLDLDVAGLSGMLFSWYLCGYHTGCYASKMTSKGPTSSSE